MRMRLIDGIEPGAHVSFRFNGEIVEGREGESIASALMRYGRLSQRVTRKRREQRGYYCGMGLCWECTVRVEDEGAVRSCMFPVREGLCVTPLDESDRL